MGSGAIGIGRSESSACPPSAQAILQVFDARGREQIRLSAASGEVAGIPMQGLAPGPYSLRCTSELGTWSTKFLKQ